LTSKPRSASASNFGCLGGNSNVINGIVQLR
jgi:hypothetical protein